MSYAFELLIFFGGTLFGVIVTIAYLVVFGKDDGDVV